jgi:hypothetical protein
VEIEFFCLENQNMFWKLVNDNWLLWKMWKPTYLKINLKFIMDKFEPLDGKCYQTKIKNVFQQLGWFLETILKTFTHGWTIKSIWVLNGAKLTCAQ